MFVKKKENNDNTNEEKKESDSEYSIYTLNMDNTVTKVNEKQDTWPTTLFPLTSDPKNIKDVVFMYGNSLMKGGNMINTSKLICFGGNYSVVRIFKDIFLAYDDKTNSWVLFKMVVSSIPSDSYDVSESSDLSNSNDSSDSLKVRPQTQTTLQLRQRPKRHIKRNKRRSALRTPRGHINSIRKRNKNTKK